MTLRWPLLACVLTPALLAALVAERAEGADWPSWRGPNRNGVSVETVAPTRWNRTENVRWRTPLPEPGNSTPIIWGETLYLTQSVNNRRVLVALDRRTGKARWNVAVEAAGKERTRATNPYCSPSPETDGEVVVVWYGSLGLRAYDGEGQQLWHRDLGPQTHEFGYGSSPVLFEDRVFLNFGPGTQEFVVAVDKRTGEELWRARSPVAAADDSYGTWSTPVVARVEGKPQVVVALRDYFAGLDPATGAEIWSSRGLGLQAKASPAVGEGIAVISGDLRAAEIAVRLGGAGDVTDTHRLWRETPPRGRIGTGIIHRGHIYGARANGVLDCVELETGDVVWAERAAGAGANSAIWSSPVLVGDRLYVINQGGDTIILRADKRFDVVAVNPLGEPCAASPVIAYGDLFVRTAGAVWCIKRPDD